MKIDPYNFELYRFKVCVFFETQRCSLVIDSLHLLMCNMSYIFNNVTFYLCRWYILHTWSDIYDM